MVMVGSPLVRWVLIFSSRNKILDLNGRINKFIQSDYVIVFSGTIPGYSGLVCFV